MNENEIQEVLLENAYQHGEVVVADIVKNLLLPEQQVVSIAEGLVSQGLLKQGRPGAYGSTESGREAWESVLRGERAEVVRKHRPWQPV